MNIQRAWKWWWPIIVPIILLLAAPLGVANDASPCRKYLQQHNLAALYHAAEKTFQHNYGPQVKLSYKAWKNSALVAAAAWQAPLTFLLDRSSPTTASTPASSFLLSLSRTNPLPRAAQLQLALWKVFQEITAQVEGMSIHLGTDLGQKPFFTVQIERPTGPIDYLLFTLSEGPSHKLRLTTWTDELGQSPTIDRLQEEFEEADPWPQVKNILAVALQGKTTNFRLQTPLWFLHLRQLSLKAIEQEVEKLFFGAILGAKIYILAQHHGENPFYRLAVTLANRGRMQVIEVWPMPAAASEQDGQFLLARYEISVQDPHSPGREDLYYGAIPFSFPTDLGRALGSMIGSILSMPQGDAVADPWRQKMIQETFADYHRHYHF